jgi:hypothetical protein
MSESTLLSIASNYGYSIGRRLDLEMLTKIANDEEAHRLVRKYLVCDSSSAARYLSDVESYIQTKFLGKGTQ